MDINEAAMTLLLEENKALKAQINKLKEAAILLFNGGWDDEHSLLINDLAKDTIDSTPLHCLNQVKADAVQEFYNYYGGECTSETLAKHLDILRNSNG